MTGAAEAATSERDVLLATKLTVPGLRADLVPRPRLAQRLDEGQGDCWPSGSGVAACGAVMPATTRPGSGGMRWPRWTGCGRGSASGWARCSDPRDTVKKHVSHVLGKLGAANRTEAVTRARELGLIS